MLAADPIERQVRQVRRRRNLHELQRALFLLIAVAAAGAAVLVVLALAASERLFAVAAWSVSAAIAVTVLLVTRELRQRWMAPDVAASWIDRRARLRGTLASLVATRARATDRDRFFLPLLAKRNLEQLPAWRPERLVRRRVPLGALASALTAMTALVLAIMLAPGLRPRIPEIVYSDQPVDGTEVTDPDAAAPDRVIVAPSRDRARTERGEDGTGAGSNAGDDADERSALERLPGDVQDRIRRELWGKEWERARDAMARDERTRGDPATTARASDGAGGDPRSDEEDDAADEWETAGLQTRDGRRGAPSAFAPARGGGAEASDADAKERGFGDEPNQLETGAGSGEIARGAGNETDPNLFGAPSDATIEGGDTFELAITAPVRAQRAGPRRASGDPPPPSRDAHPDLARSARQEQALRKMAVPAAYEAIVREVFAHRDPAVEQRQ